LNADLQYRPFFFYGNAINAHKIYFFKEMSFYFTVPVFKWELMDYLKKMYIKSFCLLLEKKNEIVVYFE